MGNEVQNYIEITDGMEKDDREFFANILFQIRDYAIAHDMEPDDTIRDMSENMLALLKIATFNGGEKDADRD